MCDILNFMHDMPDTLREIGTHTTTWTVERDDDMRKLAAQQQQYSENPFSDEHLQMRWAMFVKADLQEHAAEEEMDKAILDLSWIDITKPNRSEAQRCSNAK